MKKIIIQAVCLFSVVLVLIGCATPKTVGFVPDKAEKWGDYTSCSSTAGYFRFVDGVRITVFMFTGMSGQTLWWYFQGNGELRLDFKDKNAQVEFVVSPSGVKIAKEIKFIVEQRITEKHPEIPKGMDIKYDFDRGVVLYGEEKNIWWGLGPREFFVKGELKAPRYFQRVEVPPVVSGSPNPGYRREDMHGVFSLGGLLMQHGQLQFVEVRLPEFFLNGKKVGSARLKFNYSDQINANSSRKCIYWHRQFPGVYRVLFHRLNPLKD